VKRSGLARGLAAVIAIVGIAALVIGIRLATRADDATAAVGEVDMPISSAIESEYGIRIERVSLLAETGIVELRYILLDADAASVIHADDQDFGDDFPHIVAGSTVIDEPTFHHHGGDLVTGRELSILYGNVDSAVVQGDTVSIEIGDLRLDGVPVG
jgi:hypothetical protein